MAHGTQSAPSLSCTDQARINQHDKDKSKLGARDLGGRSIAGVRVAPQTIRPHDQAVQYDNHDEVLNCTCVLTCQFSDDTVGLSSLDAPSDVDVASGLKI